MLGQQELTRRDRFLVEIDSATPGGKVRHETGSPTFIQGLSTVAVRQPSASG